MTQLLKGKDVASYINERSKKDIEILKEKNVEVTLAVFRVGEKDSDLSYEKGILKRSSEIGVKVKEFAFKEDVSEEEFYKALKEANEDIGIHGILVFRPLPARFDDNKLRNFISPDKDVDGCGDLSLAGIFTGNAVGFAPCTAKAAIEILDYYKVDVSGKKAVVLGRSLVIGKPVSMLLLNKNATVTICHSKTKDIKKIAQEADILICATGMMESVNKEYLNPGQTIIDVGISFNEIKGKLCGDVLFEDACDYVKAITPVPGGVGSVTTSVLLSHVVEAAKRAN